MLNPRVFSTQHDGPYVFQAVLCHRFEGQDHPDDGHPL